MRCAHKPTVNYGQSGCMLSISPPPPTPAVVHRHCLLIADVHLGATIRRNHCLIRDDERGMGLSVACDKVVQQVLISSECQVSKRPPEKQKETHNLLIQIHFTHFHFT